ncbi:MAG: thiamine phosphate synthase [Spirochaetes bacterium]|nr:thiamine phosphate synthase [Spirochaetota bacterium]
MINRLIDANINRIIEGLRVIEDVNRFILNDKNAVLYLKKIRHTIIKNFNSRELLFVRDIKKDKGKFLNTSNEFKRKDITEVIQANARRVQEGSRVLEEVLKCDNRKQALLFKKIRFHLYALEQKMVLRIKKKIDLSLYAIMDIALIQRNKIGQTCNSLLTGGATVLQLRAKNISNITFFNIAEKILKMTKKKKVPFIINDRIDIAIATGADGIHIGKKDIPIRLIKEKFQYNKIIGYSATKEKEIKEAIQYNADYAGLGPVFHTDTKEDITKPLGLQRTALLNKKYQKSIPLVIIGGLHQDNISQCIKKGIKNFAFISELLLSDNVKKKTSQIKKFLSARSTK